MSAIEIKIQPQVILLPSVLSAVKVYAKQFFKDQKDINRLVLAVEEAVDNVLNFSVTGRMTDITITVDSEDGEFTVCVLDQGQPGNYEETLQGEDRLGLTIMQNAVDVVKVENLGHGGRRQKLIKYYVGMPAFSAPQKSKEERVIEDAVISVRSPKREEMLEISRAFYGEYGLNYPNELIYYPDRLYAAVAKDKVHSTVAVDQHGNLAGHLASFQWESIPGIWEVGMAVVNKSYRNAGIFRKMMQSHYYYVLDTVKGKLFIGCCVVTHPYSQKSCLRYGFFPCGFRFNLVPADVCMSTFSKENGYIHEACTAISCTLSKSTIYITEEIRQPVQYILDGMQQKRVLCTDEFEPKSEYSRSNWSYNDHLRNGEIVFHVIGEDYAERLHSDSFELRTRGAEMITLNICACEQGFCKLYEAAKAEGFFFTALLPNTDIGDIVSMQKILGKAIDYENMVTVEPYTTLLEMIRKLDPDQRKRL